MKKYIFFFLLFSSTLFSQNHTVYGVVSDAQSGERLIGATIFIPKTNVYTTSNSYGFYSLELPKGESTIKVSYLGYKTYANTLIISQNFY